MLLQDKLRSYDIILASNSPRRRQLMSEAGIGYRLADKYDVDEIYPQGMAPEEIPVYLSELKSSAYPSALAENEILVTADTVVILGEKVLGKPTDRNDALDMLSRLSGNKHMVVTGVTLRSRDKTVSFSSSTLVFFRALTPEEIGHYVDNYRPYDKAGSYGIQEWIGYIGIERIEGSFFNVMGLPVQTLYVKLSEFVGE